MSSIANKLTSSAASMISAAKAAAAAAAAAAKKAAADAAKKAAADAAKKAAAAAAKNKDRFTSSKTSDVSKLANGKGTSKLNKDGSQTTTSEKTKKGTTTKQELTTSKSKLGETRLKFEETRTTGNRESKTKLSQDKDAFGRFSSSQSHETAIKKGNVTTTTSKQTDVDKLGNKKVTTGTSKAVEHGQTTNTHGTTTSKGVFGTKQTVVEDKVEVKDAAKNSTTTTTTKSTTGTDFALSSSREFKDGTFTLKDSADWKKNSFNKETGKEKEWKLKEPAADKGFSQTNKSSKLDKAQAVGDVLGAAGLKKTVWEEKKFDTTGKPESFKTPEFVGSRVGVRGEGSLTVGANGVEGKFKREAVAGLYAEKSHEVDGKYGKAGYQAQAKVEAKATFDASGKLNANGLDVSVGAKAGISAEASVKGTLQTKPVKFAGVDLTAGVEGNARVAAEVSAEATGKVKITRNPPTAIAEGKLGASAVVKAEADVKASAGPFSVKASGYASAGAEATASGVIGYQDGKLKLGGSLGAALGVGLGGSVAVEVDVAAIGTMAKNTADVNGDGKLGFDDVGAAASKATAAASSAVSSAASTVRSWMPW
ncbi:MAG: hypothetical protein Q8N23_13970 [Archangium sp.]|nr:hypothetical protein [Archangium sp.]MDP3153780.1 hypothetical protein [Archangium sp.]MDP3575661.1 hypothetical protein [Archangium sp.]